MRTLTTFYGWAAPVDSETPASAAKNEDSIKPGDVVRLKSGGQSMTVEELTGTIAFCRWMVAGTLEGANISIVALQKDN